MREGTAATDARTEALRQATQQQNADVQADLLARHRVGQRLEQARIARRPQAHEGLRELAQPRIARRQCVERGEIALKPQRRAQQRTQRFALVCAQPPTAGHDQARPSTTAGKSISTRRGVDRVSW